MRHRQRPPVIQVAVSDDNAPVSPAHRPTRWTVRRVRTIATVLVGLALAASLAALWLTYEAAQDSAAEAAAVNERLAVLEEDLAERARQRDAERDAAAQEQARFRANLCVVLGDLPADSPNLDRLREALDCPQPGVTEPAALTPGGAAAPPVRPSVGTGPAAPPPSSRTPTASPSPSPEPAPSTPDHGPVGDLVCGLLPLC